jgi:hypothetical protein
MIIIEHSKCAELCTQTNIHDGHFDHTKQNKTTFLYISTYLHDPSLATSRTVCTHGCWALLSTKLASSLLLWQAIFFLHFSNSVKHHHQMSRKITGNHMITFIVSVYSPVSQPPSILLFTLTLSTFPEPLYKITRPYSISSPFIHVQH